MSSSQDKPVLIVDGKRLESSLPEGTSIKDYGMGIFVEKLKENKYELQRNPSELFDMLSADEGKDKVVKKVVDSLLE